ncbi:MAG: HEPN domain-containing protein [bacterium]
MKSTAVEQLLHSVDTAINNIQSLSNISALEKSYLTGYLIVFISGVYEEAIETIINEKIAYLNAPYVSQYVQKTIDQWFRNPCCKNITQLLGKFNDSWKEQFKKLPNQSRTALDSIVNNKNSLAHGSPISVTFQDAVKYFNDSRTIIEVLDDTIL